MDTVTWPCPLVMALAGAALASGCGGVTSAGSDAVSSGPLLLSTQPVEVCTPHRQEDSALFGNELLRNTSGQPVIVKSLRLMGADNLETVNSWLLPVADHTLIGTVAGESPGGERARRAWRQRVRLEGTPVHSGDSWNLVVLLHRPDPSAPGSFQAVEVLYRLGAAQRTASSTTSLTLAQKCGIP